MLPRKSPCFKCEQRKIGCHGNCERYLEFAKKAKLDGDLRKSNMDAISYDVDKDIARRKKWHR